MGCDIHFYVERLNNNRWHMVAPPARDLVKYPRAPRAEDGWVSPFWGPDGCMYESDCYYCKSKVEDELGKQCRSCLGLGRSWQWYHSRSYDTFAILANVRNGHGFAGIKTGDGFRPIAMPRGVPDNVDPRLLEITSWDHTPSWLLLGEVLGYDWEQTTSHTGLIPLQPVKDDDPFERDSFVDWVARGRGRPKSWSGDIWASDVVKIDQHAAELAVTNQGQSVLDPGKRYFVQVSWTETYRESAETFLAFVDEFLVPLGDPWDTRLTFGFDS